MDTASAVWPNGIPSIGQRARRSRLVTARDIELFTEISGDRNPSHYDEDAARKTRFGVSSCRAALPARFSTPWLPKTFPDLAPYFCRSIGPSKRPCGPATPSPVRLRSPKLVRTSRSRNWKRAFFWPTVPSFWMALPFATPCRSNVNNSASLIDGLNNFAMPRMGLASANGCLE